MCLQEKVINECSKDMDLELPGVMYAFELRRAKYLLQCYYRTRLKKIERHIFYVLEHQVSKRLQTTCTVLESLSHP